MLPGGKFGSNIGTRRCLTSAPISAPSAGGTVSGAVVVVIVRFSIIVVIVVADSPLSSTFVVSDVVVSLVNVE